MSERAAKAAAEIGDLVNRILALAPEAGLHVGVKIGPRDSRLKREAARPGTGLDPKDESGGAEGNRP